MHHERYDRLIGIIYEAALDGSRWPDAVTAISDAMGCLQATFELHDPLIGMANYVAPLCDPVFHRPFADYYSKTFSLSGRSDWFAVGALYDSADLGVDDQFKRGEYWNEWWLPQGTGGGSLMANVAREGRTTASVTVYKPFGVAGFTPAERALFTDIVGHMIRAVTIHRKLGMAELAAGGIAASAQAPEGFVVVDRRGKVLFSQPSALKELGAAGLLANSGGQDHVRSDNGALEHLIGLASAEKLESGSRGGEFSCRRADGRHVTITVMPCQAGAQLDMLPIDRPAAILCLADPSARHKLLMDRLVNHYGLTQAEAAVALEIAWGDGRAAAAARLGLREATIRAHLSAIFGKLNIHRQAELTRFVARV